MATLKSLSANPLDPESFESAYTKFKNNVLQQYAVIEEQTLKIETVEPNIVFFATKKAVSQHLPQIKKQLQTWKDSLTRPLSCATKEELDTYLADLKKEWVHIAVISKKIEQWCPENYAHLDHNTIIVKSSLSRIIEILNPSSDKSLSKIAVSFSNEAQFVQVQESTLTSFMGMIFGYFTRF